MIGAEAPSSYHVAPRAENPSLVAPSTTVAASPASGGLGDSIPGKKKRGRPRKYGTDGTVNMALSPVPISSSAPPAAGGDVSTGKRGRGRPVGSENKQQHRVEMEHSGEAVAYSVGASFTPHIITVNAGEDVTMKVISFSQQGPRSICIISANGAISNVTIRQPDSSGGTLTYEGRFEILHLSGSFTPNESGGAKSRSGGLSVSLAGPDGRVIGGGVAGLLVAASPVQIVVGSFLQSNQQDQKAKKLKTESRPANTIAGQAINPTSSPEKGEDYSKATLASSSSFHRDMNVSLHAG